MRTRWSRVAHAHALQKAGLPHADPVAMHTFLLLCKNPPVEASTAFPEKAKLPPLGMLDYEAIEVEECCKALMRPRSPWSHDRYRGRYDDKYWANACILLLLLLLLLLLITEGWRV